MKTKNIINFTGNTRKDMTEVLLEGNDRPCFVKTKNINGNTYNVPEIKISVNNDNDYSAVIATVVKESEKAILIQGRTGKTIWVPRAVSRVHTDAIEIKNYFRTKNNIPTIL